MTYKSIVENIIEREARQSLEKVLNNENGFDFGVVEMQSKDKMCQNFAVHFKELGKPFDYVVIGFIHEQGYVTLTHYRTGNATPWQKEICIYENHNENNRV